MIEKLSYMNKRKNVTSLMLVASFGLFFPLGHLSAESVLASSEEQKVLVVFKEKATESSMDKAKDLGTVNQDYDNINAVSMEASNQAIASLENNPNVIAVEPDIILKVQQTESYGLSRTKATQARNSGLTGKGVKVAVIDSGVSKHDDLRVSGGKSFVPYTSSYLDDNGHGTHVAGIISAENNSFGVVGIAPDSDIYALKVLDNKGSGYLSNIIAGIDWSIENHMDIINLSLGTEEDSVALKAAVDRAYSAGILVVASSGNDSAPVVGYPAKYPSVIGVSATDQNNKLASYSNFGPEIEMSAPGTYILSTHLNNKYVFMSGTSMAAPYVSGQLALLKQLYPTATANELRSLSHNQTVDLGAPGKDSQFGYGLVQAPVIAQSITDYTLSIPTQFKPLNVNQTSATLSWNKTADALSYKVLRNGILVYQGTNNSFTDLSLKPNTSYQYELLALSGNDSSPPTKMTITSLPYTPIAPAGLTPSNLSTKKVTISWKPSSYATFYQVKRNGTVIYTGPSTSFVSQNLIPGTSYKYEVIAGNYAFKSQPSPLYVTTPKIEKVYVYSLLANKTFKTGNTIYIYGYSRDVNGKTVQNANVTLSLTHPNGKVMKQTSKTDLNGKTYFIFKTNSTSIKGTYSINIVMGKTGLDIGSTSNSFVLK
ncbi:S8 family serine peptidase [[Brevibacterium] frigoritolerans]|nr:S8 family serine peptidase [Peribacillus frigoritolerans]